MQKTAYHDLCFVLLGRPSRLIVCSIFYAEYCMLHAVRQLWSANFISLKTVTPPDRRDNRDSTFPRTVASFHVPTSEAEVRVGAEVCPELSSQGRKRLGLSRCKNLHV
jgi:hypothetical protein